MKTRTLRLPLLLALIALPLGGIAGSALAGLGGERDDLVPLSALEDAGVRTQARAASEPAQPAQTTPTETDTSAAEPTPPPQPKPAPKPPPKPAPAPPAKPAPKPKPTPKPAPRKPAPKKPSSKTKKAPARRKAAAQRERARKRAAAERRRKASARRQRQAERRRIREEKRLAREAEKAADSGPAGAPSPPPGSDILGAPPATTVVPSFIIKRWRIPIFLLPIYQAAGTQYGIRWEVLAAINEIETDYGRNLNVSSAGARGWMQFMPATWKAYGTDANRDGRKDPYNPVDAIFAAARYLKAAGYEQDVRRAIFAYNHAEWYVNDVIERAEAIAKMPAAMVGALTGLADGRFPVRGRSHYAGALRKRDAARRVRSGESPARVVSDADSRDAIDIRGRPGAKVVSVSDGVVRRVRRGPHGGGTVTIEDTYGNRYTYVGIRRLAQGFRVPHRKGRTKFVRLRADAEIPGGTTLGQLGRNTPVLRFSIRPAGKGAPLIDPKPILDGWRLLEATAVYRPSGRSALDPGRSRFSVGQALLLPKSLLARRVLADARIQIHPCGRTDIETGQIDRRVLAVLAYLAESGLHPTVTSLRCGRIGSVTTSGNVSHHSTGSAVDIAAINGTPVLGNQGPGSVTDRAVRALMRLQGALEPAQIISLLDYGGPTFAMNDHADHIHVGYNPGEHSDHDHGGAGAHTVGAASAMLKATQWEEVVNRVGKIKNPRVREPIVWYGPANESCKFERARAAQGGRGVPRPLEGMGSLARSEKPLVDVERLGDAPPPCFGFGVPGRLR